MKKTKYLSLVLITSALASCHTSHTLYSTQFEEYKPDARDSIPKHWPAAFAADSAKADSTYYPYHEDVVINPAVLVNIYNDAYFNQPVILRRGGFGHHHGAHLSYAS